MEVQFKLQEADFLQHQLFVASKSPAIINQRKRSWIVITLILVVLSILFKAIGNGLLFYYCLFFAVVTLIFYPLYLRRHYKKQFEKYIAEHYKSRFDVPVTVTLNEDTIITGDGQSTSAIKHQDLESIHEIKDYVFLKLKTVGYMVIPKYQLEEKDNLITTLKLLAQQLNIPYELELDWTWK